MKTVTFVMHKDGKSREMKLKMAKHLSKAGKGYIKSGEYLRRDMVAEPVAPPVSRPKFTPAAKKLADELSLDVDEINGTGEGGTITVPDVRNAAGDDE